MTELNINHIEDYLYCPMFYKLCHIDKKTQSYNASIEKHFINSIKRTCVYYFQCLQDGYIPSLKDVRDHFGDLYILKRSVLETMFLNNSYVNRARVLEKQGIEIVANFHNNFSKIKLLPILTDKEYNLIFENILISGYIPVLVENEYKDIRLLHFYVDDTNYPYGTVKVDDIASYDLNIIASNIAIKKIYNKPLIQEVYGVKSGRFKYVYKEKEDKENFKNMILNVSTAIQNKMFYTNYSSRCINCGYKHLCIKGK